MGDHFRLIQMVSGLLLDPFWGLEAYFWAHLGGPVAYFWTPQGLSIRGFGGIVGLYRGSAA